MSKKTESMPDIQTNQTQIEKLAADGITDPAHQAIITDEYAGRGGSYLFDPATGKRTPIE